MTLYINGEWISAQNKGTFSVYNPFDQSLIGEVADAEKEDVLKAIDSASVAFESWSKTTAYQRSECLYRAYQLMLEHKERLAQLMTQEQGKPLKFSMAEVQYAADFLLWFAEQAKRIYGQTIPSARADQRFIVQQHPVGVVAAVTPWNYPISMITRKLAPAIAAGCTVVLKPAESTPLCAIEVFKLLEQAGIPNGVVNLVTSAKPEMVGDIFTSHPAIKKISFTGSTNVGRWLSQRAGQHLKKISMELGGHAPFIVMADANPVHAAKGAVLIKFLNTGQACISPNRMYVQRDAMPAFLNEFKTRVAKLVAGNGLDAGVGIGPLINQAAVDKMQAQVDDAVAKGATIEIGGKAITENGFANGCFFEATVLSGVTKDMLIYHEETFGPIAALIEYDNEDELIALANDTDYGLAAYVYTQNLSKAMRMTEALEFSIIGVNDINPTSAAAPFGGMKSSGVGREGAEQGIYEYLESKTVGISI